MDYVIMTKSVGNCKNLIGDVDDPLRGEKMRIVPLAEETHQRRAIRGLVQANTRRKNYLGMALNAPAIAVGSAFGETSK
jgi:hypothetical protein